MGVPRKSTPVIPNTIRQYGVGQRGSVYGLDNAFEEPTEQSPSASTSSASSEAPPSPNDAETVNPLMRSAPASVAGHSRRPSLTRAYRSHSPDPDLLQSSRSIVSMQSNRFGFRRAASTPVPQVQREEGDAVADALLAAKRKAVVLELVTTEREYLNTLVYIEEIFYRPMVNATKWPTEPLCDVATIRQIFSTYPHILNIARKLLEQLDGRTDEELTAAMPRPTSPTKLSVFKGKSKLASITPLPPVEPAAVVEDRTGALLLPYIPHFGGYITFMQNYDRSATRFEREMDQNPVWKNFMSDARRANPRGRTGPLPSQLLTICQRVPRYKMLLERIKRYTPEGHPDSAAIAQACNAIEKVAQKLDQMMLQHSTTKTVLTLQRSFVNLTFELITPGRQLIKMGRLRKAGHEGRGGDEPRAFFLFSDMLLCASVEDPSALSRSVTLVSDLSELLKPMAAPRRSAPSQVDPMLEGKDGKAIRYRLEHRLAIETLTVSDIGKERFELRSPIASFRVTAESVAVKTSWLELIRSTKNDFLAGRASLQQEAAYESGLASTVTTPDALSPISPISPDRLPPSASSSRRTSMSARASLGYGMPSAMDLVNYVAGRPLSSESSMSDPGPRTSTASTIETPPSSTPGPVSPTSPMDPNLPVATDYVAPIWMATMKTDTCLRCHQSFTIRRRRHHCRLCGDVVCGDCFTKAFVVPASAGREASVAYACSPCYDSYFGTYDLDGADVGYPLTGSSSIIVTSPTVTDLRSHLRTMLTIDTSPSSSKPPSPAAASTSGSKGSNEPTPKETKMAKSTSYFSFGS